MITQQTPSDSTGKRIQLALGAASLFLFIVGLKRTFHVEDLNGNLALPEDLGLSAEEHRSDSPAMT